MKPLDIVPLKDAHLGDAAELAAARYRALRGRVPLLPARYGEAAVLLPRLRELAGAAPGVAALRGGRLAGFLVAWLIPSLRGQRAVYSPEWANGAQPDDARRIYQAMYAAMSAHWVADRAFDHFVTLLAHDRDGLEAWQWLGFGYAVVDALRELSPVRGATTDLEIRRAAGEDVEDGLALWLALCRHLAAAPTFLVDARAPDPLRFGAWLGDPANALWLGYRGEQAVAALGLGPASDSACTVIRDDGTASIVNAFTREEVRGGGIGTALLDRALAWARSEGYERCAVDFEAMNIPASRFWLRHFRPVCHSLARHVNENILG
jgi:GNAT superfamily N-acetyltransferase